jgi:hypothetical protein
MKPRKRRSVGERDWLWTGECARVLGVSTTFIRGEIADGRLRAVRIERPHGRDIVRVPIEEFRYYVQTRCEFAIQRLEDLLVA